MSKSKNLLAVMQISDERARKMLEEARWPDGAVCVHCASKNVTELKGKATRAGLYKCKDCRKQFTVTVNTPMERSHIPLSKWVIALYMMVTARKGVSALQLQRDLGIVSYEAAWHMAHRLRKFMMTEKVAEKLGGVVEIDEAYVGGKPRPFSGGPKPKRGRGTKKTPVFLMVERDGKARVKVVHNVTADTLQPIIKENVDASAIVNTDEWKSYEGLGGHFADHKVVNHREKQYVDGDAYTNTAESFFAIVKCGHYGIFHYLSKKHLHRYCDEFAFKWDHREAEHYDTVVAALGQGNGKRLRYRDLVES